MSTPGTTPQDAWNRLRFRGADAFVCPLFFPHPARLAQVALILFAARLCAQSPRPPVVLLNGYQATCSGASDSSSTFGSMQSLLTADGRQVAFFDNCSVRPASTGNNRPTIEELAQAFGAYLDRLGAPEVDVVAHSMGGLIVRAWVSGKLPGGGFSPPIVTHIRKAVFIATPHAGLLAISGIVGSNNTDSQTVEMFAGSRFLWDLSTWNQRTDDLRGIDALSIAGNKGGGSGSPHSHDGVVVLTSASLGTGRVRVLPYCHADNLPSFLCSGGGVALVTGRDHPTYRIVSSFLSGSTEWQTVGADASQDEVLSEYGGVLVDYRDQSGNALPDPGSAVLTGAPSLRGAMPWNSEGVAFADYLRAGEYQVAMGGHSYPLPVVAGGHSAVVLKQGPRIDLVAPAAGEVPTLSRAPGMLIAIYGANLQDASVSIDGVPSPVFFNSARQINTIVPDRSIGLVPLVVTNAAGRDTVNVLLETAAPAIFSSSAVSASSPANPGETISIFLTGLGVPVQIPSLQADGIPLIVLGASPVAGAPGVIRLDFIAPQPQAGSQTIQLQAFVGRFSSNLVTLAVSP